MWGKIKSNGDDWMYPKPHMDLRLYSLVKLFSMYSLQFVCSHNSHHHSFTIPTFLCVNPGL